MRLFEIVCTHPKIKSSGRNKYSMKANNIHAKYQQQAEEEEEENKSSVREKENGRRSHHNAFIRCIKFPNRKISARKHRKFVAIQ